MYRNLLILVVTILFGAGLTYAIDHAGSFQAQSIQPDQDKAQSQMTTSVPDFAFQTIEGDAHTIKDFRGKTVVLNFWASWCAPCIKEFPLLLDIAAAYPDDLVFIGLSSDFDETAMNKFLTKMAYENPDDMDLPNVLIALDENGAITRDVFQTLRLPETIIIAPNGQMVEKLIGANWTMEDFQKIYKAAVPR